MSNFNLTHTGQQVDDAITKVRNSSFIESFDTTAALLTALDALASDGVAGTLYMTHGRANKGDAPTRTFEVLDGTHTDDGGMVRTISGNKHIRMLDWDGDVRDYGAIVVTQGDDTSFDSTAAIQAALNTERDIKIPDVRRVDSANAAFRYFKMEGNVELKAVGQKVSGTGDSRIIFKPDADADYPGGFRVTKARCVIENIDFRGDDTSYSTSRIASAVAGDLTQIPTERGVDNASRGAAISILAANDVVVRNCIFRNFHFKASAKDNGIVRVDDAHGCIIEGNYFEEDNTGGTDIAAWENSGETSIINNTSHSASRVFCSVSQTEAGNVPGGDATGIAPLSHNIISGNIVRRRSDDRDRSTSDQTNVGTTGGASGVSRSTDAVTITLPEANVTSILANYPTGAKKVSVLGATQSTVNGTHTITASTTTTITFSVSGLNTAISGGGTDPAGEATIQAVVPSGATNIGLHGIVVHYAGGRSYSTITNNILLGGRRWGVYLRGADAPNVGDETGAFASGPNIVSGNIVRFYGGIDEGGSSQELYMGGIQLDSTRGVVVSNNIIENIGYDVSGSLRDSAYFASGMSVLRGGNDILITNNMIKDIYGSGINIAPTVSEQSDNDNFIVENLRIFGNTIADCYKCAINISNRGATDSFKNVSIKDNHLVYNATQSGTSNNHPLVNLTLIGNSTGTNSADKECYYEFSGNSLNATDLTEGLVIGKVAEMHGLISGNEFERCTEGIASTDITNLGSSGADVTVGHLTIGTRHIVEKNFFRNCAAAFRFTNSTYKTSLVGTSNKFFTDDGGSDANEIDQVFQDNVSVLFGEQTAFDASGNKQVKMYANNYPQAGSGNTYRVGDVVINNEPAAGEPYAWVCTTSGTPGTWKQTANLA